MTDWVSWQVSDDRAELVGPCGCRLPNSFEGVMQARGHECDPAISSACECVAYTIRTDYGTGIEHDVDRSSCPVHGGGSDA